MSFQTSHCFYCFDCVIRVTSCNNNNQALTCWRTQGAIVEEAIRGVVAAAAHSSSAVSEELGLALFLKVGSRGLKGARKGTRLFKERMTIE